MNCRLPGYARFVFEALSLSRTVEKPPAGMNWNRLLQFCDRTQLTLPLALSDRVYLPAEIRERLDRNLAANARRWASTKQLFHTLAASFNSADLDFLVVKGFTHCPLFIDHPRFRVQYDLDLLFPRPAIAKAYDVLRSLNYEPIDGFEKTPLDHLPAMVQKTGWTWKGDYFDTDMPLRIELHFRLWDEETEGFEVCGLDSFWARREQRQLDEIHFQSFDPVDMIGYATLHLVRHLLRGDVRLFHVYEVARLLHRTASDQRLWQAWRSRHEESLQRVSLVAFALAQQWFRCALPPAVKESMHMLSGEVHRWLQNYAYSPISGLVRPNKDELWLHWNLISSPRRRVSMIVRRLLPKPTTAPVQPIHLTKEQLTWRIRWSARYEYALLIAQRVLHHVRAVPGIAISAVHWFSGRSLTSS
jgi:hypothetical protein